MKWALSIIATVALAVLIARRQQVAESLGSGEWPDLFGDGYASDEPTQETTIFESAVINMNPLNAIPANVPQDVAQRNVRAMLDTIAYAEGTAGPDGYRMHFGGSLFDSFADHPRVVINMSGYSSSAAGRYQILRRTWDGLRGKLGLKDFSPASQDAAAIELIRERGALPDVQAGRFSAAIKKIAPVWASLPGAGYNQPERKLSQLQAAFQSAGGFIYEA